VRIIDVSRSAYRSQSFGFTCDHGRQPDFLDESG
jgi:hypothetical protein